MFVVDTALGTKFDGLADLIFGAGGDVDVRFAGEAELEGE